MDNVRADLLKKAKDIKSHHFSQAPRNQLRVYVYVCVGMSVCQKARAGLKATQL